MKLFNIIEEESSLKKSVILGLTAFSGLLSGAIIILVLSAAHAVSEGKDITLYHILLPLTVGLHILFRRLSQQQTNQFAENMLEKITLRICNAVRHVELAKFETYRRSDIYLPLTDAQVLTHATVKSLDVFQNLIAIGVAWLYTFSLSSLIALLILGVFLVLVLGYELFQKLMKTPALEQGHLEAKLFNLFHHILDGFKETKINALKRKDLFENHLNPCVSELKESRIGFLFYFTELGLFTYMSLFIFLMTQAFILPEFHPYRIISDTIIITLFFSKQLWIILATIPDMEHGKTAYEKIKTLFDKMDAAQDFSISDVPIETRITAFEEIRLEKTCFSYHKPDGSPEFSVGPLSLCIRAGESLFIVGGNGSGKSTLLKLLTGLYRPHSGVYAIDGKNVDMSGHRHLFSAIFTDFHLFDRVYAVRKTDESAVNTLLRKMELFHKAAWHEGNFTTLDLSAGQRKRLALIISLMEEKPVCIFDEWAADQDPGFRAYFYENILPSLTRRGKAVIVVTHDEKYFSLADQVMKMEDGRLSAIKEQPSVGSDRVSPHKEARKVETGTKQHTKVRDSFSHGQADEEEYHQQNRKKSDMFDQIRTLAASSFSLIRPRIYSMALSCIAEITLVAIPFSAIRLFYHGESMLGYLIMYFAAFFLHIFAFRRFERYLARTFETNLSGMRLKLMNDVQDMDLRSFERIGHEKIYTVVTHDIKAVSVVSHLVTIFIRVILRMLTILTYLFFISWKAALVCCLIGFFSGIYYIFNQMMIFEALQAVRESESRLFREIRHLLDGFKELRLNQEKSDAFFRTGLKPHYHILREARLRFSRYMLNNDSLIFGIYEVLLIGTVLLASVTNFFSKADLLSFTGLLMFLPVTTFLHFFPRIIQATHSWQRLDDLEHTLGTAGKEVLGDSEIADVSFSGIRYEEIRFDYGKGDADDFSVGPLTLSFQPGEIVFISGGNGSGKTTLIKMMTGLYPMHSGRFFLNGRESDIRNHRDLFSVIFYDFHLFDRLYGYSDADEEQVRELLRIMKLERKVGYAENKFSTLDLSTGQRKRLAMISAQIEDRPVCIFDEWAAGQDPQFRQYFYETLLPFFRAQGKTVIAITHDDRYFHVADRILKLDYGQLGDS